MALIKNEDRHVKEVIDILAERAAENFPGAKYVSVYSHTKKRMVTIPIHEAITSQFSHGTDYGSGVFEGGSAMVHERTGIPHIILLDARNHRLFHRSLPSRGYHCPVSEQEFSDAIRNLIALHGLDLFRHPDGKTKGFVRAYIRPSVQPAGLGGYGINMRDTYPIDAGIITWAWPDYLDPTLATRGGIAAVTGHQRLFAITGKHASNYGAAVKDGNMARSLGADELIYLTPYLIDKDGHEYWTDPNDSDAKLRDGVISDGPGEECVAISKDQKTLIYTPMRANRLGGTVLQYVIDHMAKKIGLATREANITLHDLRVGKYAGLAMVGNAVKITPMRQVNLYRKNKVAESIELFQEGHIPEMLHRLLTRWDEETRGVIDPSHNSLITPVT